jgi:ArsR family transcriptional regulator
MPGLEQVYAALGNEVRLAILRLLARRGESCACELAALLGLGPTTLCYHISRLVAAGLVTVRRLGRWRVLHLNQQVLAHYAPPLASELAAAPREALPAVEKRVLGQCRRAVAAGRAAVCSGVESSPQVGTGPGRKTAEGAPP